MVDATGIPRRIAMLQPTLTVNEAARFLKLKPRTIREWISAGRLRATKIGRAYVIPEQEVSRLITADPSVGSDNVAARAARIATMRGTLKDALLTLESVRDRESANRERRS